MSPSQQVGRCNHSLGTHHAPSIFHFCRDPRTRVCGLRRSCSLMDRAVVAGAAVRKGERRWNESEQTLGSDETSSRCWSMSRRRCKLTTITNKGKLEASNNFNGETQNLYIFWGHPFRQEYFTRTKIKKNGINLFYILIDGINLDGEHVE